MFDLDYSNTRYIKMRPINFRYHCTAFDITRPAFNRIKLQNHVHMYAKYPVLRAFFIFNVSRKKSKTSE